MTEPRPLTLQEAREIFSRVSPATEEHSLSLIDGCHEEPIIAARDGAVANAEDGWTIKTQDGSWTAHTEHTIVVTSSAPLILTA